MSLSQALYQMMQDNRAAGQPTDYVIGTVTGVSPLEITDDTQAAPLRAPVLMLTEPVVEKKIPVLEHNHVIRDTYSGGGSSENSLLEAQIICQEHGNPLPVKGGYIILNRALEVGDKVIMLRVENGQRYIVLSRVFEVS